eukprot:6187132-Pleurochrysis_carterae.AAC.1
MLLPLQSGLVRACAFALIRAEARVVGAGVGLGPEAAELGLGVLPAELALACGGRLRPARRVELRMGRRVRVVHAAKRNRRRDGRR